MSSLSLIDGQTPLVLSGMSSLSFIDGQTSLVVSLSLIYGQTPLVLSGMHFLSLIDGQTPLVLSLSLIDRQTLLNWSSLSLTDGQMPLVMSGMSSLSVIDGQTPLFMSGMSSLSLTDGQTPLVSSGTSSFRQDRSHQSFLAASGLAEARARRSLQKGGPKPQVFPCYRNESDRQMARDMFTNGSKPHQCFCAPNGQGYVHQRIEAPSVFLCGKWLDRNLVDSEIARSSVLESDEVLKPAPLTG